MINIKMINIADILPHRAPFLFIDGIEEFVPGEKLVAVKNITADEPMLVERFDGRKCFPATLVIEAAAQAALLLYHFSMVKSKKHPKYILGRISSEFFKTIYIGDKIFISSNADKLMHSGGYSTVTVKTQEEDKAIINLILGVDWR